MTKAFDTVWDAAAAIKAYAENAALPEETHTKLASALTQVSPVALITKAVEILYSAKEWLDEEGNLIAAGAAALCAEHAFGSFAQDNRGTRIMQAHLREAGVERAIGNWPSPEDDPQPHNV